MVSAPGASVKSAAAAVKCLYGMAGAAVATGASVQYAAIAVHCLCGMAGAPVATGAAVGSTDMVLKQVHVFYLVQLL